MEVNEISQLANILRECGDKVLNSFSKLSLPADLLSNLNTLFNAVPEQRDSINSTFQINNAATKVEVYKDVQFLQNFMQKTLSLKLTTNCYRKHVDEIDLCNFKSLKLLEIHKVNVDFIRGLQFLRTQLQHLVCSRNVNNVCDVLAKCGADNSEGFIWNDLKKVVFAHNNLCSLDSSFEYVPWLHTLDLSHNKIRDADLLSCLPNLKHLNLSYNELESIPAFKGQLCGRLQMFILNNNYIEDLQELSVLVNLTELDLCDNSLLEHSSLAPLSNLAALQWLNLERNPLSFHPQHRTRTSCYLHSNVISLRFVLEHNHLNKVEQHLVGSLHPISQRVHQSSVCSVASESTVIAPEKPSRVREAIIADENEEGEMEVSVASIPSILMSDEHLEIKQQIEYLRKEYGEGWLHSYGGSLVQDALGIQKTVPYSSSPYEVEFYRDKPPEIKCEEHSDSTFVSALDSTVSDHSVYAVEPTTSPEPISDDEDLADGEESIYIADIDTDPVLVILTKTHIKERSSLTAKEIARWPLESLLKCEMIGTTVQVEYETVRRLFRSRKYAFDEAEALRFYNTLQKILTEQSSKKIICAYHCMKCSAQFERERKWIDNCFSPPPIECPVCQSNLIIEDDAKNDVQT